VLFSTHPSAPRNFLSLPLPLFVFLRSLLSIGIFDTCPSPVMRLAVFFLSPYFPPLVSFEDAFLLARPFSASLTKVFFFRPPLSLRFRFRPDSRRLLSSRGRELCILRIFSFLTYEAYQQKLFLEFCQIFYRLLHCSPRGRHFFSFILSFLSYYFLYTPARVNSSWPFPRSHVSPLSPVLRVRVFFSTVNFFLHRP